MTRRIKRAIELLAQCQAICYVGRHTGHRLKHDRGRLDAHIWADYINVGMEHGSFDMAGLAKYMRGGLVDGGPTRSGHDTPAVIVEARSTAPTRPMCASTPGSSTKSSAAAFTESCCAKRNRRVRFARLSNRAAIRIIRPGSIRTCPRRSNECTAPAVKRALAGSASVPAVAGRK